MAIVLTHRGGDAALDETFSLRSGEFAHAAIAHAFRISVFVACARGAGGVAMFYEFRVEANIECA
jgi:hypothetical protein